MFFQIVSDALKQGIILNKFIHSSSRLLENHYEVLKLNRDCTQKQIRDSYIKLSKENHPDKNKSTTAHEKFLKITEAYNVLSKPHLRNGYDIGLSNPYNYKHNGTHRPPYDYYEWKYHNRPRNPWADPLFYKNRDKSRDYFYNNKSYYGINGIKRVSNGRIVAICIVSTFFIVVIQIITISKAFSNQRKELMRKSLKYETALNKMKYEADLHGNAKQVELLKHRLGLVQVIKEEKHEYSDDEEDFPNLKDEKNKDD